MRDNAFGYFVLLMLIFVGAYSCITVLKSDGDFHYKENNGIEIELGVNNNRKDTVITDTIK